MTALRQWVTDHYEPFADAYQDWLDRQDTAGRDGGDGPVVGPPPPPPPPPGDEGEGPIGG